MKLNHLYEWQLLAEDKMAVDDHCFIEFEKKLTTSGIRTRVLPRVQGDGFDLWVPMKDYEVAFALYKGEAKAIIDAPKELYHVFSDDLSFKNKVLYEDKYKINLPLGRYRWLFILSLILIIMLMIFRFVNVS